MRMPDMPTLENIRAGGKRAVAQMLSLVEGAELRDDVCVLLDRAYVQPIAQVIGLTGPPGVGKSTLIDAMIRHWRGAGLSVGVIAVDPSSHLSGGALLGDRIRMRTDPEDTGVFVRSLAARGRLGGLSDNTFAAVVLMRAVYDRVIVETVGVGQSEADIAAVADTVLLCVQPGSGDTLQFMKAGIMEIPHVAVVTKADFGAPAQAALRDLRGSLGLSARARDGWEVKCAAVSASAGEGVSALIGLAGEHFAWLGTSGVAAQRHGQAQNWMRAAIASRFGAEGVKAAGQMIRIPPESGPFSQVQDILRRMRVVMECPADGVPGSH